VNNLRSLLRDFIQQSWNRSVGLADIQTDKTIIAAYGFHSRQPAPGFQASVLRI
jgi:hypothetical protein